MNWKFLISISMWAVALFLIITHMPWWASTLTIILIVVALFIAMDVAIDSEPEEEEREDHEA